MKELPSSHLSLLGDKYQTASESEDPRDESRFKRFTDAMGPKFTPRRIPVRSSYVSDLHQCPRYFMFRDRCGYKRKGQIAEALYIGTLYHEMMEAAGRGLSLEDALKTVSRVTSAANSRLLESVDESGLLPSGRAVEEVIAANERGYSQAQMMFSLSCERFLHAPFIMKEGWEVMAVELPLEVKHAKITTPIRCKPDLLMVRPSDDTVMIVNHKTTGSSPYMTAATYSFNVQARIEHFCTAAYLRKNWPALKVKFYLHNVIQKCTLRYPAKKYPDFDSYLQACTEWYESKQVENPHDPPMLQSLMHLADHPMTVELFTLLREASRACACDLGTNRFYRNPQACFGKFGNSPCPFLPLCTSAEETWASQIDKYEVAFREDEEAAELKQMKGA